MALTPSPSRNNRREGFKRKPIKASSYYFLVIIPLVHVGRGVRGEGRLCTPLTIEEQMRFIRRLYAIPLIEGGLVLINLLGFLIGTIYWYGPQMQVISPLLWPWLVDSPLSVLGFGLALPLIRREQSADTRVGALPGALLHRTRDARGGVADAP